MRKKFFVRISVHLPFHEVFFQFLYVSRYVAFFSSFPFIQGFEFLKNIFHPIVLFQTCTSLSDRAGYFFAQRSHCGKKEEIDQRKPKNIREEKNLEIIPCDGVPG